MPDYKKGRCWSTVELKTKFNIVYHQCGREAHNSVTYRSALNGRDVHSNMCKVHTASLKRRLKNYDEKFKFNSDLRIEEL